MRVLAVLLVAVLCWCLGSTPAVAAGQRLFALSDPRLDEASGLAVGHRSPGVLYVQNDSGDSARFFALDARTGRTRAVCDVPGASNVDWEDLATGPDQLGVPSVWLADIGDNSAARAEISIYRVDEPAIGSATEVSTGRPDRWRLRYPDGPHDAESLIADPVSRRLYLVTKSILGRSEVFSVPAAPDPARVQALTAVGTVDFAFTGTAGGPNVIGQLTATGASMSADGSLLVIRTYTDAYLWPVAGADVPAALRAKPTRIALPAQPQGEGIALEPGYLLIDSEGVGSTVYRVPLPVLAKPASTATAGPTPASTTPPGPTTTAPSPSSAVLADRDSGAKKGLFAVAAAAVLAVLAGLVLVRRTSGRR